MGPTPGSGTGSAALCGVPRAPRSSTPACCRSTTAAAQPAGSGSRSARPRASEGRRPGSLEQAVLQALGSVVDPELDRSLVELGFATAEVDAEGHVAVELRLPTFWCAPNFAYLMAQDARDAIGGLHGVRAVSGRPRDHCSDEQVTHGVGAGQSFDEAFPEMSDGRGLEPLRRLFHVKAFTVAQERVLRRLMGAGRSKAEITELRLAGGGRGTTRGQGDLGERAPLGLSVSPQGPPACLPH